jgi:hypothetical protein
VGDDGESSPPFGFTLKLVDQYVLGILSRHVRP